MNGEYRKMEAELRKFCRGSIIVRPGEEHRLDRRRIRTLRTEKKERKGTRKQMGGIGRIRRAIRTILSRVDGSTDGKAG